jgi:hypothetical protein
MLEQNHLCSKVAAMDKMASTLMLLASLCKTISLKISTIKAGSGSSPTTSGERPASCRSARYRPVLEFAELSNARSGDGGLEIAGLEAVALEAGGRSFRRLHMCLRYCVSASVMQYETVMSRDATYLIAASSCNASRANCL